MKSVLITGIGKGIGQALAEKFLNEGFAVLGTATTGSVGLSHERLTVYQLELSSSESIAGCARTIARDGKTIDVLINNAAVLLDDDETAVTIDKLRKTLEVNLIGTIDFTERMLPIVALGGHIINISSTAGSLGEMKHFEHSHAPYRYPAYKISKAALNMYTCTLALRMQHEGKDIIISSVHPGWVKTDMGGDDADVTAEEAAAHIFAFASGRPETGGFWYNGERLPW